MARQQMTVILAVINISVKMFQKIKTLNMYPVLILGEVAFMNITCERRLLVCGFIWSS